MEKYYHALKWTSVTFSPGSSGAKAQCFSAMREVVVGRLCCKSRKLQGYDFFAKTQSGKQSLIRITSIALPKSPMSLT
jgi:hypothetical protein